MSYLLRPEDRQSGRHSGPQAIVWHEPVSWFRVFVGVGLGTILLVGLAGVPSWSRVRTGAAPHLERRYVPGLGAALIGAVRGRGTTADEPLRWAELALTTDDIGARLQSVGIWEYAILMDERAEAGDVSAAGLADAWIALALTRWKLPGWKGWRLLLLDAGFAQVAELAFTVPTQAEWDLIPPEVRARNGFSGNAPRPDWPRAVVFTRAPVALEAVVAPVAPEAPDAPDAPDAAAAPAASAAPDAAAAAEVRSAER